MYRVLGELEEENWFSRGLLCDALLGGALSDATGQLSLRVFYQCCFYAWKRFRPLGASSISGWGGSFAPLTVLFAFEFSRPLRNSNQLILKPSPTPQFKQKSKNVFYPHKDV